MKSFPLVVFILFVNGIGFSQVVLKGSVADEEGRPLAFASIALLNLPDSTTQTGVLSREDGSFEIQNIAPGTYRLQASLLGFEKQLTETFVLSSDNRQASIDIVLRTANTMLAEAVVTASKPLFEQKADRLVMNVSDSPIASGGTALEILQKMPGVLVIQDRVTLAGSQSVQIWIDGKPSQYADMNAVLRDMPGDQIERIELITQPGAKFDATGGSIINIVLKRNANLGFNGTATLTSGGSVYDNSDVGTDDRFYNRLFSSLALNYRRNQWNLYGSGSIGRRNTFDVIEIKRYIGNETYLQANYDPSTWNSKDYRVGADYFAGPKTTVGVLVRGFHRTGESRANNLTNVLDATETQELGSFTTENNTESRRNNFFSNLNVKHDFDAASGHALNFDLDYSRFQIRNISQLNIFANEPNSTDSRSEQRLLQPIQIYVAKVDYTLPLDSTSKLETGLKTSFATIDNDLQFLRGGVPDISQSNAFLYRENINAAYLNLSKKLPRWDFNAGLRMEQTIVSGDTEGERVLERNYVQWFPSVSSLYHVNQHFGIQGAYSRRVNRPGFQQQNPFAFFIDSLTYQQGNPSLLPETADNMQLGLTYDNQPFIRISYGKTYDVIIENAPRIEGTRTFTTTENLAEYERWAFELNFPVKYKKLIDGFGGNQFILNAYDAEYLDTRFNRSKWNWLAYGQLNVNLPADIKLELGGWYMTQFLEEFFDIKSMGGMSVGLSKKFWNDRGRLALSLNDVLYTEKSRVSVNFANVIVNFDERRDSRNARLTFTYRFGNTELKSARKRDISSDSETSRVKVD